MQKSQNSRCETDRRMLLFWSKLIFHIFWTLAFIIVCHWKLYKSAFYILNMCCLLWCWTHRSLSTHYYVSPLKTSRQMTNIPKLNYQEKIPKNHSGTHPCDKKQTVATANISPWKDNFKLIPFPWFTVDLKPLFCPGRCSPALKCSAHPPLPPHTALMLLVLQGLLRSLLHSPQPFQRLGGWILNPLDCPRAGSKLGVIAPLTWVLISGCLSCSGGKAQSGQLLEIKFRSDEILIWLAAGVQILVSFESGAGFGPADSNKHPNLHSYAVEGEQRNVLGMGHPPHKLYELSAFIAPQIPAGCQLATPHPAFEHPLLFQMPGDGGGWYIEAKLGAGGVPEHPSSPESGWAGQGSNRRARSRGLWGFTAQLLLPDGHPLPRLCLVCKGLRSVLFWELGLLDSSPAHTTPSLLRGRWQGLEVWIPFFIFFFFSLKNFWMPTWLFCLQEIRQTNAKGDRDEDSALPSRGRFLGGPTFPSLCCYE